MTTIEIQTTGDEQSDFDAIEDAAACYVDYEPIDAEPGERLVLADRDGNMITFKIVGLS